MECDLLLKEDEFYKENEKLEFKTRQLMQKVNDVMKIQDNLIRDTFKTQAEISVLKKQQTFAKIPSLDEVSNEDLIVAKNDNGVVRIYKAKLKSFVLERERLQNDLRLKTEEARKLQKDNQIFKEDKEKWFLLYNTGKIHIGKLESHITNLNAKLQSKETEVISLKKEVDQLKKEVKNTGFNFKNCEVRLTRACEEGDKLRAALKQARDDEKGFKDGQRKQTQETTAHVKQLEKQKMELLNGFKKQMQLIDVLKRQMMHLEAIKVAEITETDYLKILEWKFD